MKIVSKEKMNKKVYNDVDMQLLVDEDAWVDKDGYHYLKQFSVITDREGMLQHLDRVLTPEDKANLLETLEREGIAGVFKKVPLTDLIENEIAPEIGFKLIVSKVNNAEYLIGNIFDLDCAEELTSQEQAIVTSAVKRLAYRLFKW